MYILPFDANLRSFLPSFELLQLWNGILPLIYPETTRCKTFMGRLQVDGITISNKPWTPIGVQG